MQCILPGSCTLSINFSCNQLKEDLCLRDLHINSVLPFKSMTHDPNTKLQESSGCENRKAWRPPHYIFNTTCRVLNVNQSLDQTLSLMMDVSFSVHFILVTGTYRLITNRSNGRLIMSQKGKPIT